MEVFLKFIAKISILDVAGLPDPPILHIIKTLDLSVSGLCKIDLC